MNKYLLIVGIALALMVSASLVFADSTITTMTSGTAATSFGLTAQLYVAQSFTATQSGTISTVSTGVMKHRSPPNTMYIDIEADSGGFPSGTSLGQSGGILGSTLPLDAEDGSCTASATTFTWSSPVSVTNAGVYWLVYSTPAPTPNDGNHYTACGAGSNPYADGQMKYGNTLGSLTSFTNEDGWFSLTIASASSPYVPNTRICVSLFCFMQ